MGMVTHADTDMEMDIDTDMFRLAFLPLRFLLLHFLIGYLKYAVSLRSETNLSVSLLSEKNFASVSFQPKMNGATPTGHAQQSAMFVAL